MAHFIKTGFWESKKKGSKGELNLESISSGGLSYRTYVALLSQSGTNAPIATILENSLGFNIVWSRNSNGNYTGTGAIQSFLGTNTFVMINNNASGSNLIQAGVAEDIDNSQIFLVTSVIGVNPTDDLLYETSIEIRVYP